MLCIQVLSSTDTGKDIVTVSHLLAKHKNAENNLNDIERQLEELQRDGDQLVSENIPGKFRGFTQRSNYLVLG